MSDSNSEIEAIKARLDRLESQMAFLERRVGIASREEAPRWQASPRVIELVRKGDKKEAIRAFIDETGASLKDAKNFVESLRV